MNSTCNVTDHRGIKVRTATGKKYYVVIPNGADHAKVIKRTDSAVAALRELGRWNEAIVHESYLVDPDGKGARLEARPVETARLKLRADHEKRQVKARKAEVARWGRGY